MNDEDVMLDARGCRWSIARAGYKAKFMTGLVHQSYMNYSGFYALHAFIPTVVHYMAPTVETNNLQLRKEEKVRIEDFLLMHLSV